jgi:hypothetical protein
MQLAAQEEGRVSSAVQSVERELGLYRQTQF